MFSLKEKIKFGYNCNVALNKRDSQRSELFLEMYDESTRTNMYNKAARRKMLIVHKEKSFTVRIAE